MSAKVFPPADDGITLKMVMEHMEHRDKRLMEHMQIVMNELRDLRKEMNSRFTSLERRLTMQIDAIDQRLDAVEIENLPKRVRRIEKHLKLAAA